MIENGYLILADITGYSMFLNESELDHAQDIITSLIKAILKPIHPPIILHRVEGDAVFAYTTKNAFMKGETLLTALEQLYFGFADMLESNRRNTTCKCKACANMGNLDLKMVLHYGEFGLQDLGPQRELIGTDVNQAHRLLKNNIRAATGADTYLFISEAAAVEMQLEEFFENLIPHSESYEDVGTVKGYVYDLAPLWQVEKENKRIFVEVEESFAVIAFDLPVPPPIAWEYLTDPSRRARFREYDDRPIIGLQKGRISVGTTYHCAHGDKKDPETIVDWKPFDYFTYRGTSILNKVIFYIHTTTRLEAIESGSHVRIIMSQPELENPTLIKRVFMATIAPYFKRMMGTMSEKWRNSIREIIEEDQAAGVIDSHLMQANDADMSLTSSAGSV